MGIDLVISTMWAELVPWKAPALEVILDRNHWAPLGTPRSGPSLSHDDRIDAYELTPSALVAGLEGARAMKTLLASIEGAATTWSEPLPPPARTTEEVLEALDGAFLRDVYGDALDRLRVLALALQAGAQLREDATFDEVRAAFSLATGRTPRAHGAFSALLAMSLHTVWVPTSLSTVWETPAFVIASSRQLAEDLDRLPACLHDADPDAAGDLFDLSYLIGCFREALAEAGESRCVVMTG